VRLPGVVEVVRELRAEFPPEPPVGSVILDWEDAAWQRFHAVGWLRVGRPSGFGAEAASWHGLLVAGAVRVIYEPEVVGA
jgi:hypothetical protein